MAKLTSKKAKKSTKIVGKKIGANLILLIDGNRHSRKVTKEEADLINKNIELYNKKLDRNDTPEVLERLRDKIIKLMTPLSIKAAKIAETKEVAKKALKKKAIKEVKEEVKKEEKKINLLEEIVNKKEKGELTESDKTDLRNTANAILALLKETEKIEEPKVQQEGSLSRRVGESYR